MLHLSGRAHKMVILGEKAEDLKCGDEISNFPLNRKLYKILASCQDLENFYRLSSTAEEQNKTTI